MNFKVTGGNPGAKITLNERRMDDGVLAVDVRMELPFAEIPEMFTISWDIPIVDCYSTWSPSIRDGRSLGVDWAKKTTDARLASWMPVHALISMSGRNRLTIAISDAALPTRIGTGVVEESACFRCDASFFTLPTTPITEYSAVLRLDTRDIPYWDSIYDVVNWWEHKCGYDCAHVPEYARLPMNSLWYSFHQELDVPEIIRQCELSKPLGMDTVIVDDGWQTDDNSRGYAYCGDWEVAASKIPDMKDFADQVHRTGMKLMIWYSVPFVGIHSEAYKRFRDKVLDNPRLAEDLGCYSLDPRYREVREYLADIYARAVRDWGLDGLKLDFIDSFALQGRSLEPDDRRDYPSLEDAVDALMREVTDKLTAINPEILIEFRQSYVGPTIRRYGNMLRVGDCPNDGCRNRQDVVNLRLTSGRTAVHSDMLMWSLKDTPESVGLQLASILYSVPQISVRIDELPAGQYKTLRYYLRFWREHRELLLDGKLTADNPETGYSRVRSELDGRAVVTLYDNPVADAARDELIAVNATGREQLLFRGCGGRVYRTVDCTGETVEAGVLPESDITELRVPVAGMVFVGGKKAE